MTASDSEPTYSAPSDNFNILIVKNEGEDNEEKVLDLCDESITESQVQTILELLNDPAPSKFQIEGYQGGGWVISDECNTVIAETDYHEHADQIKGLLDSVCNPVQEGP